MGCWKGLPTLRQKTISSKSRTVLIAELETAAWADHVMAHFWYFGGAREVALHRHSQLSNYLWVDGHATTEKFSSTFDLEQKNLTFGILGRPVGREWAA